MERNMEQQISGPKKKISRGRIVLFVLAVIIGLDTIEAIVHAIRNGDKLWVISLLLTLAVVIFILYRSWETVRKIRENARAQFESTGQKVGIGRAAIFSLTWSREIFRSIPDDRKQLVRQAFWLIGAGMAFALARIGLTQLSSVMLIAALVLAGVNLLIWVVASEREAKDRLQIELEAARQLQMSLMPTQDPQINGFDISGCCLPAQNVGGDHYDYVWFGRSREQFGIAVVDVSGKGMDAALTAIYTSGAFVSEVQHETDVAIVVNNLNAAIRSRQTRNRFVSIFLMSLEISSRTMQYINAGQSRPLLLRGETITVLASKGMRFPLGVAETSQYESSEIRLEAGDRLLLYTDGVSEAMDRDQQVFGEERLKDIFVSLAREKRTARETVAAIKERVLEFSDPGEPRDDLTIVVVNALG